MKKIFNKKTISLLLVFQMAFSMSMQAFATTSYFESHNELLLKEELRKAADETQYPNGIFEFLAPSMNTSEDLSSVEFAIVRKGGTTGKASITFKAIDVTAKYGEDYTISVQKGLFPITLPNNPDSKPLIESFEDIENASVTTGSSIINERSQPITGSGIQYEELPTPQLKEGGSGLRAARDAFTGTVSERATWREADRDTINKALIAQNEMFDEMPGITYTYNFEDGEYIKKIRFDTINDTISEDDEQVLFVLLKPLGASLGESINAYMNIEDNEEKEKVAFEMAEDQIIVDRLNGYVEVKVRRTAGLHRYGFIQLGTAALTAKPEIDYEPLSTQLNFVPGQETQTVRIPLLGGISDEEIEFIVKLDPDSPNITEGGKTKTLITIKAKPVYLMQTVNTQPESSNHLSSYRSIKIYLKNLESNEDAYIKPKVWKSAEIYEEGPAQYVGTLEFSYGPDSTLGEFYEWEYARFRPKVSDKFSENYNYYDRVYLWGYKIERKGGLAGDRYYYVDSEYLEAKELLNNQLKDHNGKTIPLSEVLMEGNTIAVLPVYKPRTSFIQINFDTAKGGMDKNSFSNGQIIKVGMMDTIEFRAFANGGNAVSGYEQVHSYMYYDYVSRAPDNYMERDYNKQKTEDVEIFFGDSYKGCFYRADMFWSYEEMTTNPVLPGEMNYKPVATFSKVSVRYGTSSLTVKADPTYGDMDKGSVAYFPDEGIAQAGNSENPMVISPVERNKLYIISGVPDKGYRMVWKDWTGDINGDGYLDKEEVDRFGKYESMFDRKTVAGNFFTYVPTYDHPLIYYGFEPIGSGGAEGKVSGRILLKGKSILNDKEEDKPLAGVSLNINGHSISTDENGEFEIIHSDFKSNQYQNIIIEYNGIRYMGHLNVNVFTNIVIGEYDTFAPNNFEAYNSGNGNKIDFRTIDNRDAEYSFRFNVESRKQGISAAEALIRFYSKDGIERTRIEEIKPQSGIFTFEFNPSSLNILPGDTMTVQLIDQNGNKYMEHNAGFFFKKNLDTFSLLSSFKSPAKPAVDLIGKIDAAFDLGLAGKIDDYMDKTGKEGTEWIITFGFSEDWEKSLSDGSKVDKKEDGTSSNNAAAEELKEAAKNKDTGEISDKVEKSVDKDNKEKKTSSITSDIKFGISTSLFLRMTVDQDPASTKYGEVYFNEMIMSATFTGEYDKKVERMTPIGVTLFVGINFKGGVTGMLVIEKYDRNFYFEDGEIDFSKAGTDNLDRDFTIYGKLMVKPSITLYAGAKITGANVTLDGTAAFDLNFTTTGSGNGKVRLSSELTLEILFFTYSWEIAGKEWDLFSYGKSGSLSMDDFLDASILYESAENYDVMPRDYLKNRGQWQNDNGLLMSAYGLETIAQNEHVLQTGIYPYPYTLLATIEEDSFLLIFLDDDISHDDRNRTQLYYSIYNGKSWSIPQKVDDDDTPDGLPWLYDIGDKVLVAWSSSVFEIDSDDTVMSVLNNRNIKSRFFNKEDKTFGNVQEVTQHTKDDTYADTESYIAYWKNEEGKENLMIAYKKSDYGVKTDSDGEYAVVGDIINPYYFTSAYRFYDFDRDVWDDRAIGGDMPGMFYGQGFINLSKYLYVDDSDIVITGDSLWSGYWSDVPTPGAISLKKLPGNDPYVVDANAIGYNNYAVLAYVLDFDGKQGTTTDREIFLQLYSFKEEVFYPPIRLTDDFTGQYCLEFVNIGEDVYLYYLSDGDIQSIDIGYLLEDGLLEYKIEGEIEGAHNIVYVLNKLKDVYRKPETLVEHSYDLVVDEEGIERRENEILIDEYMAKSDDNFVYLVWGQDDITYEEGANTEKQYREKHIYAARKTLGGEKLEWSEPVKITEGRGANYNDIDFEILPDGKLRIVFVKGFSKVENVAGQLMSIEDISSRILMTADYDVDERNTIAEINPLKVQKPNDIVSIDISVHNNSLSQLNNITYEVLQESEGVRTIIDEGQLKLRGGEKVDLSVPWQAPDKLEDVRLRLIVKDGEDILCSHEHKIATQAVVDVVEAYANFVGRNKIVVSGVAVNNGNVKIDDADILAESSGVILGSASIGALNVGERKSFIMLADINSELFESNVNEDGSVAAVMEFTVHSETGTGLQLNLDRYADGQDISVMNNINSITLKSGNRTILEEISMEKGREIIIEPQLTFSDESLQRPRIVYESSDEAVAGISSSGKLSGQSPGTAVITAYAIPQINSIILLMDNFIKVDNFETLPDEAVKIKSFLVNVTRTGRDANDKDDFSEPSKPEEPTDSSKITFKDVAEDDWYYDAVSFIAAKGITLGTGDGYFGPEAKLTRGQFIVMIMRSYGINPDENSDDNFDDAGDTYYTGYLAASKRMGLSSGVGNNLFAPDKYITRQEMFALLYRLLRALDVLPKATGNNKIASFTDVDQIDSWALDAMTLFSDALIIQGSEQKLNPKETTNRAQMAQVLYNILK